VEAQQLVVRHYLTTQLNGHLSPLRITEMQFRKVGAITEAARRLPNGTLMVRSTTTPLSRQFPSGRPTLHYLLIARPYPDETRIGRIRRHQG
jgi:hypothetical protein